MIVSGNSRLTRVFRGLCILLIGASLPAYSQVWPWWSGPVRVHPVYKRSLTDSKGAPFFWLGDTNWALMTLYAPLEADRYLEVRQRQGFTVIQTQLTFGALDNSRTERPAANFEGQEPWINGDPLRPNETFFRHVDWVLEKARARNLLVALSPVWGLHFITNNNLVTARNARAYGRWLGQRYQSAGNLIWMTGGDSQVFQYAEVYRELIAGLREGDGGAHLVSYHPGTYWPGSGGSTIDANFNPYGLNESALDLHMIQTWQHYRNVLSMVWQANQTSPVKPVVHAEAAYEGGGNQETSQVTYLDIPAVTPYIIRRQAYWALFAGGFHTYGHWDIWTHNPGWEQALEAPGARQMQVLRTVFEQLAWPELAPDNSILPHGAGSNSYVAARVGEGRTWLVYFSEPSTLSLDLARVVSGSAVRATWIHTQTGEKTVAGEFSNQSLQEFTSPDAEDALLLLESVS